MWELYSCNSIKQHKMYVWVNPAGVIAETRIVSALGYLNQFNIESFVGEPKSQLKRSCMPGFGELKWSKKKTKMSQEELAKGWLIL